MRHSIVCAILAVILACCSVDPNEQANKLFVEAQQLIEAAAKQEPEQKLQSLVQAEEKLKTIVVKYPCGEPGGPAHVGPEHRQRLAQVGF